MVNTTQPKLNKQKSKLRLRLGIGSPSKTQDKQQKPDDKYLSPNDNIPPLYERQNQLMASTSTTTSDISRTDSRSAFTYDFSSTPSPNHPQANLQFDTISYNTISPESLLYHNQNQHQHQHHGLIHQSRSTSTLITSSENDEEYHQYQYEDVEAEEEYQYGDQPIQQITCSYDQYSSEDDQQEQSQLVDNTAEIEATLHPAISTIAAGTDDIFCLTDQQLANKFRFISEIGFGNWGSVWLCKPKHWKGNLWSNYQRTHPNGYGYTYQDSYVETIGEKALIGLGKKSVVSGGTGAGGKVAIKLVTRSRNATTAARVRALWGEMKIIRSFRHEPHPSIIQFEAFVITPSYALIIMPHLARLIPVQLSPAVATPYLRQLASAVAYLHERGITHNDIKPANVMLSHNDIPVLVDFGFAQQWDINARGSFLSSISWGTPEYLDPIRARAMPHDERASDVWSLGITMFEILTGRTPFEEPKAAKEEGEEEEEEPCMTAEDYYVYYERSRQGQWIGEYSIPEGLENLLRHMINPDPAYRISAMQSYQHPALLPSAPSVIITPHFVRAAASFNEYQREEPIPAPPPASEFTEALKAAEKKKKRKVKRDAKDKENQKPTSVRAVTPALGESIKQHTSISKPKLQNGGKENVDVDAERAFSKLVIRKRAEDIKDKDDENDDPTPTKVLKPAKPLRIKELSLTADKKVVPRTSNSNLTNLSRPTSSASQNTAQGVLSHATSTSTLKDKRVSVLSSSSTVPKSKEEAVLKTMRSLEGTRRLVHQHEKKEKATEALASIKRHAPEPPRPKSLDSAVELKTAKSTTAIAKKDDERRSSGLERTVLIDVQEEEIDIRVREGNKEVDTVVHFHPHDKVQPPMQAAQPMSPPRDKRSSANRMPTPSPQKVRRGGRKPHAELDTLRGKVFPASDDESPLIELRNKILVSDEDQLVRYRQASGDLGNERMEVLASSPSSKLPSAQGDPSAPSKGNGHVTSEIRNSVDSYASKSISQGTATGLHRTKSIEALEMDDRLNKMSNWIKSVEGILEDARKAIAEGREPPLPLLHLPQEITQHPEVMKKFGLSPDKALPAHLRTSSTQVEPSTPPKWATAHEGVNELKIKEAEEKILLANKWMEEQGRKGKKDRPSVSHVLKLFGTEKERPSSGSRSNTPDIAQLVPLKPPAASTASHALKGAPSTPALRSSTTRGLTRVPMRKSESNLRNFNTMPTIPSPSFVAGPEYDPISVFDHDDDDDDDVHHRRGSRRVMFENLLSGEPGVVRQGEGWGSLSSGKGFMMGVKPSSSMASLRERARALLGDKDKDPVKGESRHITDWSKSHSGPSHKLEKRSSKLNLTSTSNNEKDQPTILQRPNTPSAQSVLTLKNSEHGKKGWLKSLKGAMGMGKKMDKVEEGL